VQKIVLGRKEQQREKRSKTFNKTITKLYTAYMYDAKYFDGLLYDNSLRAKHYNYYSKL